MRALAALAALGLSACAPGQCDPSQAGFLSGIGCETSGSYATRSQYQQSALAQQNANTLQMRAAAADEGARANQAVLSRDQAQGRLSAVDRQTAQLRARLNAARARGGADQARLEAAQAELATLERQRAQVPAGATEDQVRALEARRRRLAEQMSGL